jgi:hypothetical protein
VNIYRQALLSQGACNLSGLARSLAEEIIPQVREEARARGEGTDYVNSHPAVRLFLEQMIWLCRRDYFEAYRICEERAGEAE